MRLYDSYGLSGQAPSRWARRDVWICNHWRFHWSARSCFTFATSDSRSEDYLYLIMHLTIPAGYRLVQKNPLSIRRTVRFQKYMLEGSWYMEPKVLQSLHVTLNIRCDLSSRVKKTEMHNVKYKVKLKAPFETITIHT